MDEQSQTDLATGDVFFIVIFLVVPVIITVLFVVISYHTRPRQTKTKYDLSIAERKILNKYHAYILNPKNNILKLLNTLLILSIIFLISPIGWICIIPNTYLYIKLRKRVRPLGCSLNNIPAVAKIICNVKDRDAIVTIMSKIYGAPQKDYIKLIERTSELLLKFSNTLAKKQYETVEKADAILFVGYFVINTIENAIKRIPDENIRYSIKNCRRDIIENVFDEYFNETNDVLDYYHSHDSTYENMPLSCKDKTSYDEIFIWNYTVSEFGIAAKSLSETKYVINLLFEISVKLKNVGIISADYFEDQSIDLSEIEDDEDNIEVKEESYEDVPQEQTNDDTYDDNSYGSYTETDINNTEPPTEEAQNRYSSGGFKHLNTVRFSDKRELEVSLLNDDRVWINDYRTGENYVGYTKKGIGFYLQDLMSFINMLEDAITSPNYNNNLSIDSKYFLNLSSDSEGIIAIRYCVVSNGRIIRTKKGLTFTTTNAQKLLLALYKISVKI